MHGTTISLLRNMIFVKTKLVDARIKTGIADCCTINKYAIAYHVCINFN